MLPRALTSSMQRTSVPHARQQQQGMSRRRTVAVRAAEEGSSGWAWGNKTASRDRRPENVAGDFYVDHTCIDCDTCRWMAPETFTRVGEQSAVHTQPSDSQGRVRALQALLSCPTFSIHTASRTSEELQAAQKGLPRLVPGTTNVYHCGWHSERSFGAASYLIVRPEGNVMVDVPRWNPVLVKQVETLGGVNTIFLTHKDDVGDHKKWAAHFKAPRILHATEVVPDTSDVEHKLTGEGPWTLPGDTNDDITLVFTPGHTSGHVCLYYAPAKVLFSGDHLSADDQDASKPYIFVDFNWHSVPLQVESVAKLLQYDFLHVLPGHGRPLHFRDAVHRLEGISSLVQHHREAGTQGGKYREMREQQWAEQAAQAAAEAAKAAAKA